MPQPVPEPPRYDEPPLPEEPPLPDEPAGRERVFDIPDEPPVPVAPVRREPAPAPVPAPRPAEPAPRSAAPAGGGNSALWGQLLDQYKGRLPVNHRVFLNMATGVLDGDCLTVYCNNDFVRDSLNNTTVLTVLREVTSAAAGQSVRVDLQTGAAPKGKAAPKAAAPTVQAAPPSQPKPAPEPTPAPAQTPPWEESPAPVRDKLDELVAPAQQLDGFKIK